MKRLVVLQPSYLPWLGYLDQYDWADVFVLYDDVQFDKHGWRNRNRIKTPNGVSWLTVPVLTKGRAKPDNNQVLINNDQPWPKKHLASLRQAYSKTPFFEQVFPPLEAVLSQPWEKLLDLNLAVLKTLTQLLGMPWKVELSSTLGIPGRKTERLVGICQKFGVTDYLTGDAARDYLDEASFETAGVKVHWHNYEHPRYRQKFGEFEPYLSVVDLMFNHGPESRQVLTCGAK
ncbi:MAG: WbqC family protein [Vulcanimicrobiota bacterium]